MGLGTVAEGDKRWWWNRNVIMVLWMMLSVGFCIGLHCHMRTESLRKAGETLTSMCEERARMLQEQFAVSVNHVHALAILVSTFHYQKNPPALDQVTFANYAARTSFERPLLNGVAYAQRVVHAERELFENQQGWMIKTMNREPSPVQDEYAPVIYSQETVSYIEALDMMSGEVHWNQEDRENILRARATGKAVLTRPFRLLESNHLGVVLTFPVYLSGLPDDATAEERVKATAGYLGGAFDVESLVENLLHQLAGNQEIVVNVYDVTNASEPLTMYGVHLPDGHMSLSHVSMLDFGDPFRKHQMKCRYRKKPPVSLSSITTPSGIFVICMLVGYIGYAAWSHYDNVKEDFRKMEELKKQAEAADVAKSQFLATVSHEIRTPMNGVLGMLDMLLDTDLNLTQMDYAQTAQVCGRALISLINEVLDRAKIEAGKLEIESVPFDLRSILDDVISLFSAKSREKGIELAVYVSDRVPTILTGDPGRFRQIITNLVGNSVKFTERGHVFVQVHLAEHVKMVIDAKTGLNGHANEVNITSATTVFSTLSGLEVANSRNTCESFKMLLSHGASLSCTFGSGSVPESIADKVTLMVSVEDTGIGIPVHAQDRVFAPFMQADSSTSRNYGGTGIGLSISKCLVELMGGKMNFTSRPHVGSTFTFTAVLQKCGKSSGVDTKRSLSEVLPTCFRGMRAILVDRQPVRAAVTKYHLRRLGIITEDVRTINEALHTLSGQNGYLNSSQPGKQPSIFLIEKDSWDPKIDFHIRNQLLQRKEAGHIEDVPKVVLFLTTESDKTRAGSHADSIIVKPLRASTIATCFQQMLGMGKCQNKDIVNNSASLRGLLDGKNILVVDDNKVNLRVAAAALKKYGAKVECVESGKSALSLLQPPHKFDACFMDVQMPEMDGFEATRQIRIMESTAYKEASPDDGSVMAIRHLPILAMTADVIQATYEECVKCGMDGYVSKPFEEAQLYQAVAKFVVSQQIPGSS
uniref:histidine kinase n=1 Tax=Musa acuminata subsp. malaccensis TaxID=214687 RepID=A0A804L0F5_MUSAM|nr:PREDICTED: probable histidine kinase 4 isoform X1 [Musa acuminata subsp. malaccensis]XP_009381012.1 PREDICTED: probable histidine kinase 4 isoform X1 [Musa acuminata subsp. malaccensis]